MAIEESPAVADQTVIAHSFATLGFALFARIEPSYFRIIVSPPDWVGQLLGRSSIAVHEKLELASSSLFLEDFLWDAEMHWAEQSHLPLRSGPWHEIDRLGQTHYLEATAFTHEGQPLLALQKLASEFQARVELFEKARRYSLQSRDLHFSVQKTDVLIDNLTLGQLPQAQLLINALDRLAESPLNQEQEEIVKTSLRLLELQSSHIQAITKHLSADISSMRGGEAESSDLAEICRDLVKAELNEFMDRGVNLRFDSHITAGSRALVYRNRQRLELLMQNFLHLALRRAPLSSAMTFRLEEEANFLRGEIRVEPVIPDEEYEAFFRDPLNASPSPFRWALMLHFSRITLLRWGGDIGYHAIGDSGLWWFRLPASRRGSSLGEEISKPA